MDYIWVWESQIALENFIPDSTTVQTLDLGLYNIHFSVYIGLGDTLCCVALTNYSSGPLCWSLLDLVGLHLQCIFEHS
jgi:hypothetical protein